MARAEDSGWSEAELALMEKLWVDGRSLAGIAAALCEELGRQRSRSSVAALMSRNRERFPRRTGSATPAGFDVRRRRAAAAHLRPNNIRGKREGRAHDPQFQPPAPVASALAPHPHVYDATSRHLPLAELKGGECRFPVNNAAPGEAHLFCGAPAADGPYCVHHAARAYAGAAMLEAAE